MSASQSHVHVQSFPAVDLDISRPAGAVKRDHSSSNSPAGLQDFVARSIHHGHLAQDPSQLNGSPSHFGDFSFPYQDIADGNQMIAFEEHAADMFATPGRGSISVASIPERRESVASTPVHNANFSMGISSRRRVSFDGSDNGSPGSNQGGANSLDETMADEFGLAANGVADGSESGGRGKADKGDNAPAWSELKTKAGKERKRLPLACIACRRKKIRCSGEKPACKHCLRSRIPCVYKVTTRKAAPRTDYMAMLDKRLKRMEDRILKIVPKTEQDPSASSVTRAVVKPAIPGSLPAAKQNSKKRTADEALGPDLDNWAKTSKGKADAANKSASAQLQEAEENKLLYEGREALPPKDFQEHLAEIFFENVYGQAYHLLHKPSFMRKLKAGTLPPVLVLSVCAVAARFSTHPKFSTAQAPFLRGEEWASHAREIVTRQYEWPNITILTCLLILGLHEFGTCHGGRSWSLGGQAIRMAFALQLHKDLEYDPIRPSPNSQLSFIDREIRRRLMWACYMMDRFNSSGTDRPIFIKEETLKIQLPIQEKAFQLDMPGPTETLDGTVPFSAAAEDGQVSDAKSNMGVGAYMIKVISLWGKVIGYLNQGGKEMDRHSMWSPESGYSELIKKTEAFSDTLPESLKYTTDNLRLHDTEGLANQFLFLHIAIQQNILFMNRFAVTSPGTMSHEDIPNSFITQAGAKAFAAANRVSDLLKDAEAYLIAAPFVGYCAFLSSTVHIFGIFSGNDSIDTISKKNLAINVKFLSKMKRYWGMFHFMTENLREQYRAFADRKRADPQTQESAGLSPIFQYGDWFDRYPHGVSQSDFLDPVISKKKEKSDDAVLEQKPELHTVEEFFTQLSPPQSAEGREAAATSGKTAAASSKRKSVAKRTSGSSRADGHHLEPLFTDLNPAQMQEQIQQRLQHQRNRSGHLGGQTSGPTSFNGPVSHAQNAAQYHALSPISPVPFGHHPNAAWYNNELLSMTLANNGGGMLPHLDRQMAFGAYQNMDGAAMSGQDIVDWNAALSAVSDHGHAHGHRHPSGHGHGRNHGHGHGAGHPVSSAQQATDGLPSTAGLGQDSSSAWFMPFNMEPPEMVQDMSIGVAGLDGFGGVFSPNPNGMATPGGAMGMRRGGH